MTGFLLQVASEIPRRCWPRRGSEKVLLKGFCFLLKSYSAAALFLIKKMDRESRSNKDIFDGFLSQVEGRRETINQGKQGRPGYNHGPISQPQPGCWG